MFDSYNGNVWECASMYMNRAYNTCMSVRACLYACLNVCVCVIPISGFYVLLDTPENPRCRLDLFTSAALPNQERLQTNCLLSDIRAANPGVTKSVSLGLLQWT